MVIDRFVGEHYYFDSRKDSLFRLDDQRNEVRNDAQGVLTDTKERAYYFLKAIILLYMEDAWDKAYRGAVWADILAKIRELGANLRIGLDNPADTGLLFALIGPATLFLSPAFPHEIRVQPSFDAEAVFEGHLYGAVRLHPIQLAPPFLRFICSLATIRAIKTLVLTKWKRKK